MQKPSLESNQFLYWSFLGDVMQLTHLSEIGEILGIATEEAEIDGFAIDSKQVKKGHLFFALRGKKFDGHKFLNEVALKGGVAAVVDKDYKGGSFGLKLIRVPNVVEAIQKLAGAVHAKRKGTVIAITGSIGKTTTKEFLASLLATKFKVSKTPGNANSQVGLPLFVLNNKEDYEVLVIEMGMSQIGEMAKLVQIVPPDIALLTKIGQAHIGYFKDGQEGIVREKSMIFSHPKTKVGIINAQALQFKGISDVSLEKKITFGFGLPADFVLKKGWFIEERGQEARQFELPFDEDHFAENFLAAAVVSREMGLEWEEIFKKARFLKGFQLRFEKIERNGVTFINDSYNASPEAAKAAINSLPLPSLGGKVVAILGELEGQGIYSEKNHREVAELAASRVDHAFLLGKECLPMIDVFKQAGKTVEFFSDLEQLKNVAFDVLRPGDVVLIKGANYTKLWQLLS
jgi:UDP-N-acetylmuramoyl-tripeptide--D-alanyl-D-alanine ligase